MRPSLTFWSLFLGILLLGYFLVAPRCASVGKQSPVVAAFADIKGGVKSAIGQYKVDNGSYPKSLQDLVQKPRNATNWHGPYLDKIPVDPWGNTYFYDCPGKHNPDGYDLFSAGPDGRIGTEDDIGNWTK